MNKVELSNRVAEKVKSTKKLAEQNVDAVLEVLQEVLANGEDIKLVGHFSIELKKKNSRVGRNPSTGQEIQIPSSTGAKLKLGKIWKNAIANVVVKEKVKKERKKKVEDEE